MEVDRPPSRSWPKRGSSQLPISTPISTLIAPAAGRKRRRISWIVAGVIVAFLGLVGTIGAAVALVVDKATASIDPDAEARTPGTARFTAEKATYEVLLVTSRADNDAGTADDFVCSVELANERTIILDGSSQAISSEVANTETIGSFDAVAGRTEVSCDADGVDLRFVVNKVTNVGRVATTVLIVGVAGLLIGAGLILGGIFWKRTERASPIG